MFKDNKGNFPIHIGDIKLLHPDWNIGDPLPDGIRAVLPTIPPEFDEATQKINAQIVELESGDFEQTWLIVELTEEEKASVAFEAADRTQFLKEMEN